MAIWLLTVSVDFYNSVYNLSAWCSFMYSSKCCFQKLIKDNSIFCIETNKLLKEHYLIGQDNTIYKFSIDISLSSKEQNKSKLQKQRSNVLISYFNRNGSLIQLLPSDIYCDHRN